MLDTIKPDRPNWRHYFGSFALWMLILQFVTGVVLTLFYEPSLKDAYKSVQYITNEVTGGSLSRNLHRWIAFALFAAVLVHTLRSTFRKDFINPNKRVDWMTGALLVFPLFLFLYTGLVLPWEWKGYWFMEMMASYAAAAPVIGPGLKSFILSEFTLPRFLIIHILLLPLICLVLADYHLLTKLRKRGIFRHLLRHLIVSIPFIAALVVLAVYVTIPSKDPDDIPMPLDGAYIPTPEWVGLLPLLPFKYFKGSIVTVLSIYVPSALLVLIAFMPYYLKRWSCGKASGNGGQGGDDTDPAADPQCGNGAGKRARTGTAGIIIRGAIIAVIFAILMGLFYVGNRESPTFGCNSCHNLSRGFRMGLPPDTFRDRNTLPNLDDDKWMMGHWYYPNEIF